MAKQLNVNLAFTADTSKASKDIQALQQQLTQLANNAGKNSASLGFTKDIKEATAAIAQLKTSLSGAMSSTGTLDLTKFNDSLKSSGMTLEMYRAKLSALGPEGVAAFSQLASSISSAEIPLKRANTLVQEFGTTLANTARWQLSSSLLHGFIGGLQQAYGYAKDLNASLNDIRIVTGQSSDQMAQLADRANKAARELSTRTTDYTKASLIYYQQGLDDKAVEERTRTTLKMSNVTRQSAEEVSNQMTAIWNNFDDGTKSLEYYADAITALGAKTASSSSEIAEGLSKFAAVADTIGLSYETASAAIATVVAETRQSADTVGNAFKSIFSRIQSLKLGETLEDGVGLTKYTEALNAVGVQVLDINGNLRAADDILNDLGEKWKSISDAQKTALAQTVAGQRQYSQFVAMADNWDKIQANAELAAGSEGTLQEQADIYAESWEASATRVRAAAESIYQALIDDDFFIGFNDLLAGLLDRVNDLIKGLGGIPGVLTTIGALLTQVFSAQMASRVDTMIKNFKATSKQGIAETQQLQQTAIDKLRKQAEQSGGTIVGDAQSKALNTQADLQDELFKNQKNYNEEQYKTAQILLDQNKVLREQAVEKAKIAEKEKENADFEQKRFIAKYGNKNIVEEDGVSILNTNNLSEYTENLRLCINEQEHLKDSAITLEGILNGTFDNEDDQVNAFKTALEDLGGSFNQLAFIGDGALEESVTKLQIAIDNFEQDATKANMGEVVNNIKNLQQAAEDAGISLETILGAELEKLGYSTSEAEKKVQEIINTFKKAATASQEAANGIRVFVNDADAAKKRLEEFRNSSFTFGQSLQAVSSFAMSLASTINTVKSAIDTLNNDDLSWGEKMLQIIPSLLMSFNMLTKSMSGTSGAALVAAASHIPLIGRLTGLLGVEGAATAATATFGTTLMALLPILGIVAAGIGAIAAGFAYFDANNYSFDEQMKDAENSAEHAKKAAEELATEYEGVASAIQGYKDAVDVLDSCTTGTEAWKEALDTVNQSIDNLLDKYPDLIKFYDASTNSLDMEKVEEYLDFLKKQELAAEFQKMYTPTVQERVTSDKAEKEKNIAQGQLDLIKAENRPVQLGSINYTKDFLRERGLVNDRLFGESSFLEVNGNEFTDIIEQAKSSVQGIEYGTAQYYEALKGSIENNSDLKIKINDEIYNQIRGIEKEDGSLYKDLDEFKKENEDLYNELYNGYLQNITEGFDSFVKVFSEAEEITNTYEGSLKTTIERIVNQSLDYFGKDVDNLTKAYANKVLKDKIIDNSQYEGNTQEDFIANGYTSGKMDATGQTMNIRAQDSYYMQNGVGSNGNNNQWQRLLTQQYLDVTGENAFFTGKVTGNDTNRAYQFENKDTHEKYEIPVEQIASAITLFYNGVENFESILNDAGNEIKNNFQGVSEELKEAFGSGFQNGEFNFNQVSKNELNESFKNIDDESSLLGFEQYKSATEEYLQNKKIDKNNIKDFTDLSYDEVIEKMAEGLKAQHEGMLELGKNFADGGEIKDAFNDLQSFIQDSSLEAKTAAEEQFEQIFLNGGLEGINNLTSLYEEAGKDAEKLTEIDFSSFDSLSALKDHLNEIGLQSVASSSNLELVYNSLKNVENASEGFSERYAEIAKITDKINKHDTISAEDYATLGSDITENYFSVMADGTYQLIKDADEFRNHVNEIQTEKLAEAITNRNTANDKLEKYKSGEDYANASATWKDSNTYVSGSQNADVLREQIQLLKDIGKITEDNQIAWYDELEKDSAINPTALKIIHDAMLEQADDWENVNNKITENKKLNDEDMQKVMSLMPTWNDFNKFLDEHQEILQDITKDELFKKYVENYSGSNIKNIKEYKEALKGLGEEAGLTDEAAKEAWKTMDLSSLNFTDLSFVKQEFAEGRIEIKQYGDAIGVLAQKATSLEQLHSLLDSATPDQYSEALERIFSEKGTGTLEALDEIDKAILNNKANAELLESVYDRILNAKDRTTREKAEDLERESATGSGVYKLNEAGLPEEQTVISKQQEGLGKIELAAQADDLFDTDRLDLFKDGLSQIGNLSQLTAMQVRDIGKAAATIAKESNLTDIKDQLNLLQEGFGGKEGIENIDPDNMRIYSQAVQELVFASEDLTLDKKLELIQEKLGDTFLAEHFREIIQGILGAAGPETTVEKIQRILDLINKGIGSAAELKDELNNFMGDTSIDPQTRLNLIDNNKEELTNEYTQEYQKNGVPEYAASSLANSDIIGSYQKLIDSMSGADFSSVDEMIEFFDLLPEGVNYTTQLEQNFANLAKDVTSFDQLDSIGELLTSQGVTDEGFKNATEDSAWNTAVNAAEESEAKEIGVPVEEFRNYESTIYDTIAAENELGRSEEQLQILSMKMTKSMMDQENGFEALKDGVKKYSNELSNFNTGTNKLSVESNKAITELQQACQKLFGTKVSKNFVEKNLDDIKDAAGGSEKALQKLQKAAAKDFATELVDAKKATKDISHEMETLPDSIEKAMDGIENAEIGDDISDDLRNQFNQLLSTGELTKEELNNILNSMGYDCDMSGIEMAVNNAQEISSKLGPLLAEGVDTASDEFTNALSSLTDGARADLDELVSAFEAAGMSSGEAYTAALNSIDSQLAVSDQTVTANEQAGASSSSTFTMDGTLGVGPVSMPIKATTNVTTTSNGGGDADITIPVLGKGGASYNGGGAGAGSRANAGGGGGGRGGGCFIAGTPISVYYNKFKNIEDIKVGDIVLSYNEKTKQNEFSEVLQTMIHVIYDNIYTLSIKNEKIVTTGIHRFLINRNNILEWVPASDLLIGDLVLFANGIWHKINNIDIKIELKVVYNFEVSNNHNYYVGKNQILVHNKGRGGGGRSRASVAKRSAADQKDYSERYHKLDKELEKLNKSYEAIDKQKERAFGKQHLKALDAEIQAQERLIQKQKQYKDAVDKNLTKDLNIAKSQVKRTKAKTKQEGNASYTYTTFKSLGGNKYSEKESTRYANADAENYLGQKILWNNGVIENYDQLREAAVLRYNKAAKNYAKKYKEGATIDDNPAQYKKNIKAKNTWAREQAQYEQFIANLEQLEETAQLQMEKNAEVIEAAIQKENLKLERISYKVDLHIDLGESELDTLNKAFELLGDNARNAAARIGEIGKQLEKMEKIANASKEGIADIFGIHNKKLENTEALTDNAGNVLHFSKDSLYSASQVKEAKGKESKLKADKQKAKTAYDDAEKTRKEIYDKLKPKAEKEVLNSHEGKVLKDKEQAEILKAKKEANKKIKNAKTKKEKKALKAEKKKIVKEIQEKYQDQVQEKVNAKINKNKDYKKAAAEAASAKNTYDSANLALSKNDEILKGEGLDGEEIVADFAKNGSASNYVTSLANRDDFTQDQIDKLSEYASNNLAKVSEMSQTLNDSITNDLGGAMDSWIEKYDRIIAEQEHLNTLMVGYKNVVDLVGDQALFGNNGKDAREQGRIVRAELNEQKRLATNTRLQTYNTELLSQKNLETLALERLNNAKTEKKNYEDSGGKDENVKEQLQKAVDRYEVEYNKMVDKVRETTENKQSLFEQALSDNEAIWEEAMNDAANKFSEAIAGSALTLDILGEELERYEKVNSTFVADYEKFHQLRQLDLQAQKQIEEATDPKIRQELMEIQEKITSDTTKNAQMSEYQLTYLRQQLELKQAEAALEDAQNAKNQVSLTRDSEGNYGYVYTADADNVADAEQNYADKIYEMKKSNAEYMNELQTNLVSYQAEMQQKIDEIANNTALSEGERKTKIEAIKADYEQLTTDTAEELQFALNASKDMYGQYSDIYAQITGDLTALNQNHVENFEDTVLAKKTGYLNLQGMEDEWKKASNTYVQEVEQKIEDYGKTQQETFTAAGENIDTYGEDVKQKMGEASSKIQGASKDMTQLGTDAESGMKQVYDAVKEVEDNWVKKIGNMQTAAINLSNAVNTLKENMLELKDAASEAVSAASSATSAESGSAAGGGKTAKTVGSGKKSTKLITKASQIKKLTKTKLKGTKAYKRKLRTLKKQNEKKSGSQKLTERQLRNKATAYAKKKLIKTLKNLDTKKYKGLVIKYDTGGYTGNWPGAEGRMAMLHQKELVLNKDDTSNILQAVDMIRDISSKIDLNALAASGAFASGINSPGSIGAGTLEQNVHITAEFPNATDRNEITEAFNNIINLATQYANR